MGAYKHDFKQKESVLKVLHGHAYVFSTQCKTDMRWLVHNMELAMKLAGNLNLKSCEHNIAYIRVRSSFFHKKPCKLKIISDIFLLICEIQCNIIQFLCFLRNLNGDPNSNLHDLHFSRAVNILILFSQL